VIFYSELFYLLVVDVEVYFWTWSHTHTHTHTHPIRPPARGIGPSQTHLPNKTQISQEINIHVSNGIYTCNPNRGRQTYALDSAIIGIGTVGDWVIDLSNMKCIDTDLILTRNFIKICPMVKRALVYYRYSFGDKSYSSILLWKGGKILKKRI